MFPQCFPVLPCGEHCFKRQFLSPRSKILLLLHRKKHSVSARHGTMAKRGNNNGIMFPRLSNSKERARVWASRGGILQKIGRFKSFKERGKDFKEQNSFDFFFFIYCETADQTTTLYTEASIAFSLRLIASLIDCVYILYVRGERLKWEHDE